MTAVERSAQFVVARSWDDLSDVARLGLLKQRGITATGAVGDDKPLESLSDALAFHPATRVLLITPPAGESYWLERDLLAKARGPTNVPVAQVVVPATSTIESTESDRLV